MNGGLYDRFVSELKLKSYAKRSIGSYQPRSFPLSANEADFGAQQIFVDKSVTNCFSMLDEKFPFAGKEALGARISEREIRDDRGCWGEGAQAI